MNKQWIGGISGTNKGSLCLNIDKIGDEYRGSVMVFDTDPELPSFIADITFTKAGDSLNFTGHNVRPLHPKTFVEIPDSELAIFHPQAYLPTFFSGEGLLNDSNTYLGTWNSDSDTSGAFNLVTRNGKADETESKLLDWKGFKDQLSPSRNENFIYRGQSNSLWGLRTLFHRSGRSDLTRYFNEEIPRLYRHIHALTGLKFDLSDNEDLGSLLYLAQHHGFPTPLLDWSLSPYVAAFFAFEEAQLNNETKNVRIFALDKDLWVKNRFQAKSFRCNYFSVSYAELLASGNKRAIPQQAVTTFSTIDWIEGIIAHTTKRDGQQYLTCYDIPITEKDTVMADLRSMGITRGSLFPGLDGICVELKNRYF